MPKSSEATFLSALTRTLIALTGVLAAPVTLSATSDPLAEIRHCAAESDDARRLACYDQQFRVLATHAAPPTEPKVAPTALNSTPAVTGTVPASTGTAPTSTATAPAIITAAPASIAAAPTGSVANTSTANTSAPAPTAPPISPTSAEQRFGMNGQVERSNPTPQPAKLNHLAGRIAAISYKPRGEFIIKLENGQVWEEADGENRVSLNIGDTVTIDTGAMGAYWLGFGKHGSVRVKRTH